MHPYRSRFLLIPILCLCWVAAFSQNFAIYDSLPQLEARIKQIDKNTTLVINFWATWCKPCIEELPFFESLHERYKNSNYEVVLVSLDFKSRLEKTIIPFLNERKIKSEVILFADQDANTWIPRIEESWDGAIPATIVLHGGTKTFYHGKFDDFAQLETFVLNSVGSVSDPENVYPGKKK
jgi:thiol-disulfide isomerase/thioredoxin